MLKIALKGGLGNQMFQYAHGRKLMIVNKKEVVLDLSFFKEIVGTNVTQRDYKLENFNIADIKKTYSKKQSLLDKILSKIFRKLGIQKEGYFQSELYFKEIEDTIRKEFKLKEPLSPLAQNFLNQIIQTPLSVSLHVRRGDYVNNLKTNLVHGSCDIEYYKKSIDYMKDKLKDPTFFIFSDDIEWVKENIKIDKSVFVSGPTVKDYEELILMSECSNNIIANSTFSWWGAWLNPNPNKIVIGPKQWTRKKTSNKLKMLPKDWVQI